MSSIPTSLKGILSFALGASILSLAAAYFAQYHYGLMPCHLCLWQRVPYAVVIALALIGLWKAGYRTWITLLIGLAFLTGGGIATYHAAVEKQLIRGPSGCTDAGGGQGESVDDFLTRIQHNPVVACDQPSWEFHGITMAAMNAVWSFALAGITFAALQQSRRKKPAHA